jgi:hypothetical protein
MSEKIDRREEIDSSIFDNDLSAVYDERLRACIADTLNRLPEADLDRLLFEKVIRIIQPVVNTVIELNDLNLSLRDECGRIMLVAFESKLCDRPPHETTYIIAHEFAHVFLGHATNKMRMDEQCEILADEQVIKWGFEEELEGSSFNYICQKKGG